MSKCSPPDAGVGKEIGTGTATAPWLLLLSVPFFVACERQDPPPNAAIDLSLSGTVVLLDSLPFWTTEPDLVIGLDASPGHDFTLPFALGADPSGRVYVMDQVVPEVRRFSPSGEFLGIFVASGRGPGEIAGTPASFGLRDGYVWHAELPTGRVHFVSTKGEEVFQRETGLTPALLGTLGIWLTPLDGDEFLVEVRAKEDNLWSIRPRDSVHHLVWSPAGVDTVLTYETSGSTVLLDGRRTTVVFPAPPDGAEVFYDRSREEFVRIDRPVDPDAEHAAAVFRRFDRSGHFLGERTLLLEPRTLSAARRAAILDTLIYRASWGGGRTLDADIRSRLESLVGALPERLPAFERAALGPDGATWLLLPRDDKEGGGPRDWLVVDSTVTPIARARLPDNVIELAHHEDGDWWATLVGPAEVRYVARFRVTPSPSPQ